MNTANNYTISVIVPIYNREKTLNRCIDSILHSAYKEIELILVDDGSTDGSWEIIQSYSDERVKSIHVENGGVTVARNIGLNMSTGDYIHFVDSDDFIEPDIYSSCMEVVKDHLPDMLMFDYSVYFESQQAKYSEQPVSIPTHTMLDRQYILDNILPVMVNLDGRQELFIKTFVWNKLYKRSVIEQNHVRFDESRRRWEDRLFQVLFLRYADTFYYIPVEGYVYALGHSSFVQSYDGTVFDMVLRGSEDYAALVGDLYDFDTDYSKNYYCKVFINTALQQFAIQSINRSVLKDDIEKAVFSNRSKRLFDAFNPENQFEKSVKEAILTENGENVFCLLDNEYMKREREKMEAVKKQHSIMRRIKHKLTGILEK